MTTDEAARILSLTTDATPEQLEAKFHELRTKLEDKIAKAPTPGLKEKYRASLAEITTAFEHLTLAADSSELPLLQRPNSVAPTPAKVPLSNEIPSQSEIKQKQGHKNSHHREFSLVALVALFMLVAGGWWVLKVRCENEEKARAAAILKADLELSAARAEKAAKIEAERKAAEAERVAKLASKIGARLAEAKVEWEAFESDLSDAEKRLGELKSEARDQDRNDPGGKAERSARIASQLFYAEWLRNYLLRHPGKMARARLEQLLQSRAVDEAQVVSNELDASLILIRNEVETRRKQLFNTKGKLSIESKPDGLKWTMVDTYGRTSKGITPALVADLPLTHLTREAIGADPGSPSLFKLGEHTTGKVLISLSRPGWENVIMETSLTNEEPKVITFPAFPEGSFEITSQPVGLAWEASNDLGWKSSGLTPKTIKGVPPGHITISASRPGYSTAKDSFNVAAGTTSSFSLDLQGQQMTISVEEKDAEIWVSGKHVGSGSANITDLPLGNCDVTLKLSGYPYFTTKLAVEKGVKTMTHRFSFRELAEQKHKCSSCEGKGLFMRSRECGRCDGKGSEECSNCNGSGSVVNLAAVFANSLAEGLNSPQPKQQERVTCGNCNGRGTVSCQGDGCNRGTVRWTEKCTSCGGDGLKSLLDLSR